MHRAYRVRKSGLRSIIRLFLNCLSNRHRWLRLQERLGEQFNAERLNNVSNGDALETTTDQQEHHALVIGSNTLGQVNPTLIARHDDNRFEGKLQHRHFGDLQHFRCLGRARLMPTYQKVRGAPAAQ